MAKNGETTAFLHFSVNTFTDKEWGDGTESESVLNPAKLDARQWIKALKDAGFKMAMLTAKHHDGFCLWPSAYTPHSVKNSPWKNRKGEVVKEVANAWREYGVNDHLRRRWLRKNQAKPSLTNFS
jgi:alpha-L-fucosidase